MATEFPRKSSRDGSKSLNRLAPRGGLASVEEILKRWLKANRSQKRAVQADMGDAWKKVVGEEIGLHTRVADLSKGELVIEVDSAALLTELSTYYRQGILESLRQVPEFQGVQKIRFRSGAF